MLRALVAASILFASFVVSPATADERTYSVPPAMDISAIRYIMCFTPDGVYSGTGFLIAPKTMATAFHIATGGWQKAPTSTPRCYDVATKSRVLPYKLDGAHDFALMTGPDLPTDIPYVRYSCSRPIVGQPYLSYGITDYNEEEPIARNNVVVATKIITDKEDEVEGVSSPGLRSYVGPIAPGMSGGPVADVFGKVVAINNAGNSRTSLLYDLADTMLCTGKTT